MTKNKLPTAKKSKNLKFSLIFYILGGIFALLIGLLFGVYLRDKISTKLSKSSNSSINSQNVNNQNSSSNLNQEVSFLTIEELKEKMDESEDFILIDTRSQKEYQEEHIVGAISLPASEIDNRYNELARDKEIITYCYGGHCGPAKVAAQKLIQLGFSNVKVLDGSTQSWKAKGWQTETGI